MGWSMPRGAQDSPGDDTSLSLRLRTHFLANCALLHVAIASRCSKCQEWWLFMLDSFNRGSRETATLTGCTSAINYACVATTWRNRHVKIAWRRGVDGQNRQYRRATMLGRACPSASAGLRCQLLVPNSAGSQRWVRSPKRKAWGLKSRTTLV